ncbi:MAG: dienelactone hydrolase family protein [Chloroflexi bacterium]|nr:dienelactone hydrolase family protein [Chloroflexota bacterium]
MIKHIFTIFKWIIGVMVGAVVVLVASVIIDRGVGVNRLDPLTNTVISNGNNPAIRAYVARPSGEGPFPVVIMIHEWWGLKQEIIGKADALAQDGYVVIAPDVFRGNTTSWIPSAIWQVVSTPTAQVDGDLDAVMRWIQSQPEADEQRVAIMGFCFGGGTSIRYGVSTPSIKATVVFYGSVIQDPALLKNLNGPVLGIFGGADTMIPISEVQGFEQGLKEAGIPHEVTIYAGEPHAFVTSVEDIAKGGNQLKAWNQLRAFLQQTLYGQGYTRPTFVRNDTPSVTTSATWSSNRMLHQFICDLTVN